MELIKALVKIVTPNKIKHLPVNFSTDDWAGKLYEILQKEQLIDDKNIALKLFGENPNRRTYYNEAKKKLRERLLNALFLIEPDENNSNFNAAIFKIQKGISAMHISRYFGMPKVAKEIAEKYLKLALEYEQINEALGFSLFLKHYYASIYRNELQFNKHSQKVVALFDLQQMEQRVYNIYLDTLFELSRHKTVSEEVKRKVVAYAGQVEPLLDESISFRTAFYSFSILYYCAELQGEYERIVQVCERGLQYFIHQPKKLSKPAIFSFTYHLLPLYIKTGQFAKARQLTFHALDLVKIGSINWVLSYRYLTIIAFHQQEYGKVNEFLKLVKTKGRFQYGRFKEDWLLFDGYLHLFQQALDLPFSTKTIRPGKFLNEIDNYSSDKRNTYFNARLVYFLLCLQQEKYDLLIEQVDGLDRYASRYLKKPDSLRAYYLTKSLLQIVKSGFNRTKALKKAQPWLDKLQATNKDRQDADLELVPFGNLWNLVTRVA